MDPGPWQTAASLYNRNVSLDRRLARRLDRLSEDQANDEKIAWAVESGRCYGMRQQKCQLRQQKELTKQWRHAPTEKMW
jgi:hypothetical protein